MSAKSTKKLKVQIGLLAVSVVIIVFGLLFVLTAAEIVPVFPAFYEIGHIIVRYIIVIVTMSVGIMLFSNVAATIEDKKLRNALTIGITAFSTVLTLPLLYVFVALFPAASNLYGPVGEFMVKMVAVDFQAIFPKLGVQYLIYSLGIVMSIVFLAVPLVSGILTVKDKKLVIGKKGISIEAK